VGLIKKYITKQYKRNMILIYISNCDYKEWRQIKLDYESFIQILNKILLMLNSNNGVIYIEDTSIIHNNLIKDLNIKGYKVILNRQPQVLVLCQRKAGKDLDPKVITNLESYIDSICPNANITYLTNLGSLQGTADIILNLDSRNVEAIRFVKLNKNKYDFIILNTCPFPYMSYYMIYNLLKDTGRMIMTASTPIDFKILNMTEYAYIDSLKDRSDLYQYFIKATNKDESIFKKIIT
jgi:hypothetical protein